MLHILFWNGYFMLRVLKRTLSHMWLCWNLPIFLFRVGLFTLMKIDSLINLVKSWPSLPVMLKLSWLSWCPVSWLCTWMVKGSLRCCSYLSPGPQIFLWCTPPHSPKLCIGNNKWHHFSPWVPCLWAWPVSVWGSYHLWNVFQFLICCRSAWYFPPGPEHMGWLCVLTGSSPEGSSCLVGTTGSIAVLQCVTNMVVTIIPPVTIYYFVSYL